MSKNNQNNQIQDHEMHEDIHKLFSIAKEESLSHDEKKQGAIDFKNFMEKNPNRGVSMVSPYIKNLFISTFKFVKQRQLVAIALAVILVLGGSSGTAYAAVNSLPGDLLYPIKININEKLESVLARGTEAKARVAVKHAINRIEEVEKLAVAGKLEKSSEGSVSATLALQSKVVQENILKLKTEGNVEAAIVISSDFENSLNDHKKNLANLVKNSRDTARDLLVKTSENIHDNILAAAKERLILEDSLSTSNQITVNKKIANDELIASQKKIKKIEGAVNASRNIDKDIKDTLKNAVKTVSESEEKINVGAYNNAVVLLKDAKENTDKLEEEFKKSPIDYSKSGKTPIPTSTATPTSSTSVDGSSSSTINIQNNNLPIPVPSVPRL